VDGVCPWLVSNGGGLDPRFGIRIGGVPPFVGVVIGSWLVDGLEGEDDAEEGKGPKVEGGETAWGVAGGFEDVFSPEPVDPLLFWDFWDDPCSPRLRPASNKEN